MKDRIKEVAKNIRNAIAQREDINTILDALISETEERVNEMREILQDIVDPSECSLDHHGFCQEHGFLIPGKECPHARAKTKLKEINTKL